MRASPCPFGSQVLQNGGAVDGGGGADSAIGRHFWLEVAVDATDWELQSRALWPKGVILNEDEEKYRGVGIPRTFRAEKVVRGIPTLSGEFQRCPVNSNAGILT